MPSPFIFDPFDSTQAPLFRTRRNAPLRVKPEPGGVEGLTF